MKSEEAVIILNEQVMNAHYNLEVSLLIFEVVWGSYCYNNNNNNNNNNTINTHV